ncbi:MAG: ketopantoate reductase C-terminal domain-containing protein [Limnohabitans sp.]
MELEALLGSVIELGRICEVPTPTLDTVYAMTRLLEHSVALKGKGLSLD